MTKKIDEKLSMIAKHAALDLSSTYLDDLEEADQTQTDIRVSEIKDKIDEILREGKQNQSLFIFDAKNMREANVYALLSIFEVAQSNIFIYTEELPDSLYTDSLVLENAVNWLDKNPNRKLNILLKKEPEKDNDLFFAIKYLLKDSSQIVIRVTDSESVKQCNVNVVCADDHIYKIKEINPESKKETIALNFFGERTNDLKSAIQFFMNEDYSHSVKYQNIHSKTFLNLKSFFPYPHSNKAHHTPHLESDEIEKAISVVKEFAAAELKKAA